MSVALPSETSREIEAGAGSNYSLTLTPLAVAVELTNLGPKRILGFPYIRHGLK